MSLFLALAPRQRHIPGTRETRQGDDHGAKHIEGIATRVMEREAADMRIRIRGIGMVGGPSVKDRRGVTPGPGVDRKELRSSSYRSLTIQGKKSWDLYESVKA